MLSLNLRAGDQGAAAGGAAAGGTAAGGGEAAGQARQLDDHQLYRCIAMWKLYRMNIRPTGANTVPILLYS